MTKIRYMYMNYRLVDVNKWGLNCRLSNHELFSGFVVWLPF